MNFKSIGKLGLMILFGCGGMWCLSEANEGMPLTGTSELSWASSSNKYLLLIPGGDLTVFDVKGIALWKAEGKVTEAFFSPDGTQVAFISDVGIGNYSFKKDSVGWLAKARENDVFTNIQWSPNGEIISFYTHSLSGSEEAVSELQMVRVANKEPRTLSSEKRPRIKSFPLEPEKQAEELLLKEENQRQKEQEALDQKRRELKKLQESESPAAVDGLGQ